MKLKSGDEVLVRTGKDRGKRGRIRESLRSKDRVIIEGVNIVKKHMKARPGVRQAGIVEQERSIHASNVMLVCPNCAKPTRLGIHREAGKKQRICRHCGQSVDRAPGEARR